MQCFDFELSGGHFDWHVIDYERRRSVARTGLKWARAAVCIVARRFFGTVRCMRTVSVEHEVSDVFRHLAGARRDRVRQQNRDAWNEPTHAPKVALLTKNANGDSRLSC